MKTLTKAFNDDYQRFVLASLWAEGYKVECFLKHQMAVGEITFDYSGHHRGLKKSSPKVPTEYKWEFRRDHFWEEQIRDDIRSGFMRMTRTQQRTFKRLLKKGGDWIELNGVCRFRKCSECGANVKYKFNGSTIKAIGRCKYPKGQPPISVDIKVPSGVMVFANYFNIPSFEGDIEGGYPEHVAELEHYAKHGVAQMFCGNSCPGVYKEGDKFWIGNAAHGEDYETVIDDLPGTQVTSVTTDLWAWSMTDLYNHQKVTGKKGIKSDQHHYYSYVRVTPGTYRVTQRFYANGGYGPEGKADIFATMERIGRRSPKTQVSDVKLSLLGLKKRVKG